MIDQTKIIVEAGKGGDGAVAFLRQKFRPKGGPNGGDGGNGGSIIFQAKRDIVTLSDLDRDRCFKAEDGQDGMKDRKKGKNGRDLILFVPCGTVIKSDNEVVDLVNDGRCHTVVQGGRGGWGNWHFKTSIKQAPAWSKKGEVGEKQEIELELKLIADIGIIGLPNAGKSTFLSRISAAKPKIADYPFTTLMPNLGVAKVHNHQYIFADIPGLIEGAHLGKGLGIKFLRHIERTKLLLQLISADSPDYFADYQIIRNELKAFSPKLARKPLIIAISKSEIVPADYLRKNISILKNKTKYEILYLSAATGFNIDKSLDEIVKIVSKQN